MKLNLAELRRLEEQATRFQSFTITTSVERFRQLLDIAEAAKRRDAELLNQLLEDVEVSDE